MALLNDAGRNAPNQMDAGQFSGLNPNGVDAVTVYGGPIPPVPPGAAPVPPGAVTVPGRPTVAGVKAGSGSATVAFYAPAGVSVTTYTVRDDEQGKLATGTSSPITVTGLTKGKAHRFSVSATNSVGTGPVSSESQVVYPL
jgi:hypothetical protein